MTLFDQAFAFLLANEGTAVTQAAADRGGLTKFGITLGAYQHAYGANKTADDLRAITVQDAQAFYQKCYWAPLGFVDGDPEGICAAVFDMSVLTGTSHAAMALQSCLGVKADGKLGALSLSAMRNADQPTLRLAFASTQTQYLYSICAKDATQRKWLYGWLCRVVRALSFFE